MLIQVLSFGAHCIGGLFMGFLSGILSLFLAAVMLSSLKDPFRLAVQMGTALVFFAPCLYYIAIVALSDWVLAISAATSFLWCLKGLIQDKAANE